MTSRKIGERFRSALTPLAETPKSTQEQRGQRTDPVDRSRSITARHASGNLRLQSGKYVTADDLEHERREIVERINEDEADAEDNG